MYRVWWFQAGFSVQGNWVQGYMCWGLRAVELEGTTSPNLLTPALRQVHPSLGTQEEANGNSWLGPLVPVRVAV